MNATAVAPVRPVPVSVTLLPTVPEVGAKLVSVGAGGATYAFRHTFALAKPDKLVRSDQLDPVGLT